MAAQETISIPSSWVPLATLASATIAAFVALGAIYLREYVERRGKEARIWTVLNTEIADIQRHYERNVARIDMMVAGLARGKKPNRLYIDKLRWPEDTTIFEREGLGFLSYRIVRRVYLLRVRIRNANIDSDAALRAHCESDLECLEKTLRYVRDRHHRIADLAPRSLSEDQREPAVRIIDPETSQEILFI